MAKVKISEFDVNPDNNTDINNINIAEGCAPSGINNAIRQLMSDLKAFQTGADGDPFNGAVNGTVGATTPNTGAFTTLSASSTATLNTLSSSGATITGGSINGTTVGASTASTGAFTTLSASGAFSANGGATLGDASGDALTINSSAVSIPNGLNFDSNTLVIDATNNRVGVGTASPAQALDVVGSIKASSLTSSRITYAGTSGLLQDSANLTFESGNFLVKNGGSVNSLSPDGATQGWIAAANTGQVDIASYNGSGAAYLAFKTSTATERMRITSAGNVGIGTSSPSYKLDVAGSVMRLINSAATADLFLTDSGTTNGYVRLRGESNAMKFITGNGISGTLDASGNLGLGVTPSAWGSQYKVAQVTRTSLYGATNYGYYGLLFNAYNDNTNNIYTSSNRAGEYRFDVISGSHAWFNAPSGTLGNTATFTQAMTLDANGNLGIGTTSPNGRLTVASPSTAQAIAIWNRTSDNTYGGIYFKTSDGATDQCIIQNERAGTNGASLLLYTKADGGSATERMRIDSGGNLLVGKTSTNGATVGVELLPSGLATFTRSGGYPLYVRRNTNDGDVAVWINNGGSIVGAVTISGSTTTYNTSSDYRLKENIAPMTGALATVSALKPVTYNWKVDGSSGQGFIAHELQEVVPDCVTGEKDAVDEEGNPQYQGIDTSFLVATLTAAIQELKAEVDSLKAQLNK